jgi:undecaprenyl-diphosphatase
MDLTSFVLRADMGLDAWIIGHRLSVLDGAMWTLSAIGRGGTIFVAAGLLLRATRRVATRDLLRLFAAILLATVAADYVVKPIVDRRRPFERQPAIHVIGGRPNDASFPSGHATNSFAGAFVLSRVAPSAGPFWWALAAAIAFSRVYLGVHYPSDVLAGAALGVACGLSAYWPSLPLFTVLHGGADRPSSGR